jgi:hypothetical protein
MSMSWIRLSTIQTKKSDQILAHKPRMGETTGELTFIRSVSINKGKI